MTRVAAKNFAARRGGMGADLFHMFPGGLDDTQTIALIELLAIHRF
jgi:hypothetical protein